MGNDDAFCQAAAREPGRHGWPEGCSLAGTYRGGEAIDLDAGQFIQMEAVEGDGGVLDRASRLLPEHSLPEPGRTDQGHALPSRHLKRKAEDRLTS